jgi:hypothetical protein
MKLKSATISPCGTYRYDLWRVVQNPLLCNDCGQPWDFETCARCAGDPVEAARAHYCMFVGLNPSTADANLDDPTIRRCARSWGFYSFCMTNLFAFRATDPMKLYGQKPDVIIGPDNDATLKRLAMGAGMIVACWGKHGALNGRDLQALKILPFNIACIKKNADGSPAHPLYLKGDLVPQPLNPLRL